MGLPIGAVRATALLLALTQPLHALDPLPADAGSRIETIAQETLAGTEVRMQALRLADGRRLAFVRFGAEQGLPVFYFHSAGGSRLEPLLSAPDATRLGLTLISADRPGVGRSDPRPQPPTMRDWASDVRELADAFGIKRFAVAGLSAGGPHALACAHELPDRVVAAFPLNASSEPANAAYEALPWRTHMLVAVTTRPWFMSLMVRLAGGDLGQMMVKLWPQPLSAEQSRIVARSFEEGTRQGMAAYYHDANLMYRLPWGYKWEDIRPPVHLMHGVEDPNIAFMRRIVQLHPQIVLHEIPGGHLEALTPETWDTIAGVLQPLLQH